MVEFVDGSMLAQLSTPDMCLPIQYALTYPDRAPSERVQTNFAKLGSLTFEEPDVEKFPALNLARRAGETGGTLPAVLNAANEIAVEAFVNHKINFPQITETVQHTMDAHEVVLHPTLDQILEADAWARGRRPNNASSPSSSSSYSSIDKDKAEDCGQAFCCYNLPVPLRGCFYMTILTIIYVVAAVFVLFGAAIFVHEFGHFWVARKLGMKVEEFAIGFGPKIYSWKRDGIRIFPPLDSGRRFCEAAANGHLRGARRPDNRKRAAGARASQNSRGLRRAVHECGLCLCHRDDHLFRRPAGARQSAHHRLR